MGLAAGGANGLDVEPAPQAVLMKTVFAMQDDLIADCYFIETYPALLRNSSKFGIFDPFCDIDHEESCEYLGQHFFKNVAPAEQRIGNADEDEIETTQVEHELVEKQRFVRPISNHIEDEEGRNAPDQYQYQDKQHRLLIDVNGELEGSLEQRGRDYAQR